MGGRCGSVDSDGVSFTEKEYRYVESIKKLTIAFLHKDPDLIPSGKSEKNSDSHEKLNKFREYTQKRCANIGELLQS